MRSIAVTECNITSSMIQAHEIVVAVVIVLLFYAHGKHLRSCRDGKLT